MSASVSSILMSPPRRSIADSAASSTRPIIHRDNTAQSVAGAHHTPAFAHSSPFLRTTLVGSKAATACRVPSASMHSSVTVEDVIPDSMMLTSPSRWGGSADRQRLSSSGHLSDGPHRSPSKMSNATRTTAERIEIGLSSTYMKDYDYSQPNVSLKVAAAATSPPTASQQATARQPTHPAPQPLVLHQRGYSAQVQRTRQQDALLAATSQGSPRELLYKGLPYTWRELVPFCCPVVHPELMSYDPSGYHSIVAKQTRDIGMRMVDLEAGRRHKSLEGLDLNAERGVTGLSLEKHVKAHRMTQVGTYPGITYGL